MCFRRTLAVCFAVLTWAAVACEPSVPERAVTRPPERILRSDDIGRILRVNGIAWFATTEGRWITFPQAEDAGWLASLSALREAGFQLHRVPDGIAIQTGSTVLATVVPPDLGWLVLIVDDLGFRLDRARRLVELGQPVFLSILPDRPHSVAIARLAAEAGLPVMLHQPMEPKGYPGANPGRRAMLKRQSVEDWQRLLQANLDALPGVIGLNNHMGSALSRDPEAARVLAGTARQRDLLLVDSLTAPDSRIFSACRAAGARCLQRDVFLDNERTETAVLAQARHWLDRGERHGLAVAIGHPHTVTIDVLGNLLTEIERRRLRLIGPERLNAWLKRNGFK